MGNASALAERGDFGQCTLAAKTTGAGRKGKASTREQNAELADHYAETTGGTHTAGAGLPEKGIRDPVTGKIRFPDGEVTAPDGSKTFFNTYDTNAAGGMTKREADAAVDIIKNMPPGSTFHSVPKGR
jgi:hypothetical protein